MRDIHTLHLTGHSVLDGGLATQLEARGFDLSGPLWSARLLREQPAAVVAVHQEYLAAGAQILLTAGYQVSSLAFAQSGMGAQEADAAATAALRESVRLAVAARQAAERPGILIAASLGPYGAALGRGAEYHGNYGFPNERAEYEALRAFHSARIAALAATDADLLAFETIPSLGEARAILDALAAFPAIGAWLSFTCRDAGLVAHGEPLRDAAALLEDAPQVVAVGINCTAPEFVLPLLAEVRTATAKPVLVYPNSGEGWDAANSCWTGTADPAPFEQLAAQWFAAGAHAVGGCCRTGPAHIRAVARAVAGSAPGWGGMSSAT